MLPSWRVDDAGHDDLLRAAEALAARVPAAAGRSRAPRLQLPLVLDARGHDSSRRSTRALGALRGEPRPAAAARPAGALARAAADAELLERIERSRRRCARPRAPAAGRRPRRAPDRVLLRRVRRPPLAAGLLRRPRRAGRRHPQGGSDRALPLVAVGLMYRQGYFRQRIDAGGWQHEYWVDTDPERLPPRWSPAMTARRSRSPCRCAASRSRRRSGGSTSVACRCSCSTPSARRTTSRALDHLAALHRRTRHAPGAVHPARRRRRPRAGCDGHRARLLHLNEGHAAFVSLEAAPRTAVLGDGLEGARAKTIFTTHTPVPAGTTPIPPSRSSRRSAG